MKRQILLLAVMLLPMAAVLRPWRFSNSMSKLYDEEDGKYYVNKDATGDVAFTYYEYL